MINFIGIGAQKTCTSWVYACLYEHPEICAPIKEMHFFSRPRFQEGKAWYESHFLKCDPGKQCGEFSTSYLYSQEAAERMHTLYPEVKIIAILRNPIERAYSQYNNAIKAGEIAKTVTFDEYKESEPSVLEQGMYTKQLERYLALFPREQMLILISEDSKKDPQAFIQGIYAFLGVNASFVPSMLHETINISRIPRHVFIERIMHHTAEFLRICGFDRFVHFIRKIGLPDLVRSVNTTEKKREVKEHEREKLVAYFHDEVGALSRMLGRDLHAEWKI
jgi:hypothetical protein